MRVQSYTTLLRALDEVLKTEKSKMLRNVGVLRMGRKGMVTEDEIKSLTIAYSDPSCKSKRVAQLTKGLAALVCLAYFNGNYCDSRTGSSNTTRSNSSLHAYLSTSKIKGYPYLEVIYMCIRDLKDTGNKGVLDVGTKVKVYLPKKSASGSNAGQRSDEWELLGDFWVYLSVRDSDKQEFLEYIRHPEVLKLVPT